MPGRPLNIYSNEMCVRYGMDLEPAMAAFSSSSSTLKPGLMISLQQEIWATLSDLSRLIPLLLDLAPPIGARWPQDCYCRSKGP